MLNQIIGKFCSRINAFLRKHQLDAEMPTPIQSEEVAAIHSPSSTQIAARKALEELRKTSKVGDVLSPTEDKWEAIN